MIQAGILLQDLAARYGWQQWWPADSLFEMMCGAVLVQNTRWRNVELSLQNLFNTHGITTPEQLVDFPAESLQSIIRPSGFMTSKAATCHRLAEWIIQHDALAESSPLNAASTPELRKSLLSNSGIGPETADVISLFAFDRRLFIWSTYARRLLSNRGWGDLTKRTYESCRNDPKLAVDLSGFRPGDAQELHALIVRSGKREQGPRE